MISIQLLREKPEYIIQRLAIRNFDAKEIVEKIVSLDLERRQTQVSLDNLKAESNKVSKEIGVLYKSGKTQEANELRDKISASKSEIQELEHNLSQLEEQQLNQLLLLPNLPNESVPKGTSPEHNLVVNQFGTLKSSEGLHPHWDLASKYKIIDFELGTKVTGAGFPFYLGKGAQLQRALVNFFLDYNGEAGYKEIQSPSLVSEASGYATGQLPDKEGQMYHVTEDNFYLIPTAEVPLTNMYRDVIVQEKELPIMLTGYTPCFRREAGSYGKEVRGLNRLHQFDKVEIVRIEKQENSYQALEQMVQHVANLLKKLELPYRILKLCGGDMGFTSALTYDFEVYSPAQERWLEVSSVSNFETFQANRLKLRYKDEALQKNVKVHTLNGSSLALPRIVATILENHQTENEILIPEILHNYTGFKTIS